LCGGAAELVEDGVTGLHFKAGDDKSLAAALQRLATDPELRARLGKQAREMAIVPAYQELSEYRRFRDELAVAAGQSGAI